MSYLIKLENGFYHSHRVHTKRDGYPIGYIISDNLPDFSTSSYEEVIAKWNGKSWDYIDKNEYISSSNDLVVTQNEEQTRAKIVLNALEYLKTTDWVNFYKLRHDLGLEIIPATSSKWSIIVKREEMLKIIKDAV